MPFAVGLQVEAPEVQARTSGPPQALPASPPPPQGTMPLWTRAGADFASGSGILAKAAVMLTTAGAGAKPARPFFFNGSFDDREQAVSCLAAAAWYESGNDPEGQRSVMQVVLNRLHHPSFPKTVCGVVLQGSERKTGCQFTFTCDGSLDQRRPSPTSWVLARQRAEAALSGSVDLDVMQATHYHADYVTPWWSSQLVRLAKVGRHIFYGWPSAAPLKAGMIANPTNYAGPGTARLGIDGQGNFVPKGSDPAKLRKVGPQIEAETPSLIDLPLAKGVDEIGPIVKPIKSTAIVMALGAGIPNGRWAIDALGRCSARPDCRVLGYVDHDAATRNAGVDTEDRSLPQFVLIRDRSSGNVLALWDCRTAPRADSNQCLPTQPDAIRSFMQER
ncbi:MAG: cell wall hydrolase [Sphingomonadales bacterium]|nr:cell wall hydrolase [Sphingomonadales bacterium]